MDKQKKLVVGAFLIKMNKDLSWFITASKRILSTLPTAYKLQWKVYKLKERLEFFDFDGEAIDHEWILKNKYEIELHCADEMRKKGVLPVLDFEPKLDYSFNEKKETFLFKLTLAGIQTKKTPTQDLGLMLAYGIIVGSDSKSVSILDDTTL